MIRDPSSGPLISFGSGGTTVELYKDVAFGIPPLSEAQSLKLFQKTKIHHALEGYRNLGPFDQKKLAQFFSLFSIFVHSMPEIEELDINPIVATKEGFVILDARIVLKDF
jgi:acetyltransferase